MGVGRGETQKNSSTKKKHHYNLTESIKCLTMPGLARVETSPNWSLSPARIFLKIRLIILPDLVLGKSSTKTISLGAANGPMSFLTVKTKCFLISCNSFSVAVDQLDLFFKTTNAATA